MQETWVQSLGPILDLTIFYLQSVSFLFYFLNFYWSIVALQYCVRYYCTAK